VDAKQQWGFLGYQGFGGGDIGQNHEFFDQPVCIQPFAEVDGLYGAVLVQHDLALGQVQIKRLTCGAGGFQGGIGGIERFDHIIEQQSGAIIRSAVDGVLYLGIMQRGSRAH